VTVDFILQSDTNSSQTKLHVSASVRNDSGKYTITASNDYGSDKADIEVIVVDKPGAPTGPLTPTKITGDAITLQWEPPKDDGGAEINGKNNLIMFIVLVVVKNSIYTEIKRVFCRICGREMRVRKRRLEDCARILSET